MLIGGTRMLRGRVARYCLCAVALALAGFVGPQSGAQFTDPAAVAASSAMSIPQDDLIQPEALNKLLTGRERLIVLQVGSHVMFSQAHIRGAQYAGPGGQPAGLQLLERKTACLPKTALIVIYCGCCPWNRCPNIAPAFHRLHELGFSNVKVLYIANNFGADWAQKGYSIETGG